MGDDSPKLTVVLFAESIAVARGPQCLTPLHERPLMDWAIEAFYATGFVGSLVLVAPEEASRTAGFRHVDHHIKPPKTLQWPLFEATLRRVLLFGKPLSEAPCLLATLDAAWLRPGPLKQLLRSFHALANPNHKAVDLACVRLREGTPLDASFAERLGSLNGVEGVAPFTYCVRGRLLARLRRPWKQAWPQDNPTPFSELCKPWQFERLNAELKPKKRMQWAFVESSEASFFKRVLDSQTLKTAENELPSPWKNAGKTAMVIANPNAGMGPRLSPFFRSLLGLKKPYTNEGKSPTDGLIPSVVEEVRQCLEACGLVVQTRLTATTAEATELATSCAGDGIDIVVACGGDGSINAVVNGLAKSNAALGVVPIGTTNVYSLQMNLPTDPTAACHVVASSEGKTIDLGLVDERYFVCMAGIGFDAHVVKSSSSKLKRKLGPFAYLLVGLRELFRYRFKRIKVQIDEQPITRKGLSLFIGNGKYYGGHFLMTPEAKMNDGYLDVCIMRRKNVLNVVGYLTAILKGNIQSNLNVEYFQFKSLHIKEGKGKEGREGKNIRAQVDGDYVSERPKKVSVAENSLRILV